MRKTGGKRHEEESKYNEAIWLSPLRALMATGPVQWIAMYRKWKGSMYVEEPGEYYIDVSCDEHSRWDLVIVQLEK